jgi:hypothetical protein
MKLAKLPAPSDDLRFKIEQEAYLAHCRNIASVLAAAFSMKATDRQIIIDQYLEAVNTATEP